MTTVLKKLCLGTAVAAITTGISGLAFAAAAPTITLAQELTAIGQSSKIYKNKATDVIQMSSMNDSTLDKAFTGAATLKAASASYFSYDGVNTVTAMGVVNTVAAPGTPAYAWKTFSVALNAAKSSLLTGTIVANAGPWSLPGSSPFTTNFFVPETFSNNTAVATPSYAINVFMIGSAGATSPFPIASMGNYLASITACGAIPGATATTGAAAPATAVAPTATSSLLPTGWTVKFAGVSGVSASANGTALGAANSIALDPMAMTVNWALTPNTVGAAAVTYSANLTALNTWNAASPGAKLVNFSNAAGGGSAFSLNAFPANFNAVVGGTAGNPFLNALTTQIPNRIYYHATNPGFYNTLSTAVTDVRTLVKSGAATDTQVALNAILGAAHSPFLTTNFITNASPTQDGSSYSALVAATSSDIANVTWSTDGAKVIANGNVTSGSLKNFVCDLGVATAYDNSTGVLTFQSEDDSDAFFAWNTIAPASLGALDASAAAVAAGDKPKVLALYIANQLSAVSTITAKDLTTIIDAASY